MKIKKFEKQNIKNPHKSHISSSLFAASFSRFHISKLHNFSHLFCADKQILLRYLDTDGKICYTHNIQKGVVHCFGNVCASSRQQTADARYVRKSKR